MSLQFYAILSLLLALAMCGVLYGLFALRREKVFVPWLATWGLLALHFGFSLLYQETHGPAVWVLNRWASVLAAIGLLYSAREYAARPRRWMVLAGVAVVALAWSLWHSSKLAQGEADGPLLLSAAISLWSAGSFWRSRRLRASVAVRLLSAVCLLWFVLNLSAGVMPVAAFAVIAPFFFTLTVFNLLTMGTAMIMLAHEGVLRRVEENMMSFSLLNLATTGQHTDEDLIRMLEKVLDRVLNVYGASRGMIVVHPGEREVSARVFRGWPAGFAEEWQRRALDERLSAAVAGVGGLLSIPNLLDPGALALLDSNVPVAPTPVTPDAPSLGEVLRSAGIGSLFAATVRTQKRVFGAIVLAPRPWVIYTSAELRLLSALGVQVGMGVDNFLLMRAAARRSEELHLLNQTGRAISSTLDTALLLRRIHEELSKLMDASNSYVAILDDAHQEVSFALETEQGRYLPPRSRKLRRGMTEHLLRSEQAVLIRSRGEMSEYQRQNGIESSGRPALSWCGAPVMIRGKAAGVMAVQNYERENAYDEDHLEILRIVAAQAAVALENARLFSGEQEKLRHLTFLHSITRIAISTLNAEEMLSEIARELHSHFHYEHIGIGLLDYDTKQVQWKAEGGMTDHALVGQNAPLVAGLIGRVARSGKAALVEDIASEPFTPVVEGSRSAACLPITYAEQMLGVLNIESAQPGGLRADDLPLLQTMAGHLATALHNSLTFQRTQEQAITDGLTGVKTHRYFMEALNAEWKRSTRSGRVFSLLVLDLDRFKQVNDTMGHLEGDLVLVRLGRILEDRCRKSNVVARYGGDEFMVLMPETNIEQASILGSRLRLWIATDPMFSERHLTASFGLATYPTHGHTPEEIIRAADAGLYLAKHQGGNHVAVAEQFRQSGTEGGNEQLFSPLIENLRTREEGTGPEAMERFIKRLEEIWESKADRPKELLKDLERGLAELADLMEERVHGTSGHQAHVTRYALVLAGAMGLPEARMQEIRLAARLHDVGYLAVPGEVLEKRERLSPQEFAAVHVHAGAGARLLQAARMPPEVCEMVRHHHEFVNGRGYPDGLPAELIPVGARILAIADAFDAITADRPYRPARTPEAAMEEMERFAGTQFDELLVRTFVRVMSSETGHPVPG